mmetsp:Transcript_29516/g.70947  ORF Transcript_29516/g.70947 Transcript_29516/m.70947 type:complete len:889 (+) Transcript_29516:16-2682(+)
MSDNESSSSPMSYSDMYNDDEYMVLDDADQMSTIVDDKPTTTTATRSTTDVDFGFDDDDGLDFGGAYSVPYMMQDQPSVATSTGQERVSGSSSVSSVPSDQGGRPSSLLGGGDDSSVVSAATSVDSYGFSAVGSVVGSVSGLSGAAPPPMQNRGTANPTPYHNMAPSVTGSMSSNPYYYESNGEDDDASVEMSLVTPEPSTPGRKNPFGSSKSSLQESVKIQFIPAPQPPPTLAKTARQTSTTEYPDNPDDEFGVSVVSSLHHDDLSVQSGVKAPYAPSPFAEVGNEPQPHLVPTSPLTPVFPDYQHQQQKTLPANAPMAPLPHHHGHQQRMIDPSIPRPDDSDSETGLQINHHSEYPNQPFGGGDGTQGVYAYSDVSSASEASVSGHSEQEYHDEFLEKNQKKTTRGVGPVSVSSSVATEKPKKQTTPKENPFARNNATNKDPEAAINLKDPPKDNKKKKKKSCCRKCLCIFIPALLLILGGGGYYAYTRDFFGFDFFGLYESKDATPTGSQGENPETPQDKPANDPQETDGGISFPNTAAPSETQPPPEGVINNGGNNNNNTNTDNTNGGIGGNDSTNSTGDDIGNNSTNTNSPAGDPLTGVNATKQPHLSPVDTKPPTQSPTTESESSFVPTATPTIMEEATPAPTTKAESEIIIQYRTTIQSFLETQGISFDTTESTMTVNALDRLMNDVVAAKFQEEKVADPFFEDIYRVTQRFALYCLGVALEEPAQEDYVKEFEVARPWTPRSEPAPMYQLVFERLNAGETKSADHCSWPGVICSTGDYPEIVSISWNQQGLDGTIPSEISLLRSLSSIDLANNYIHSTVPTQVYEIPNLEKLVLNHNYLEGQLLPLETASSKLIHLDLGHNLLSGNLQPLEAVQGLRKFS